MFKLTWSSLQESGVELTDFAVEHRYRGTTASAQDANEALTHAGRIRKVLRIFFDCDA